MCACVCLCVCIFECVYLCSSCRSYGSLCRRFPRWRHSFIPKEKWPNDRIIRCRCCTYECAAVKKNTCSLDGWLSARCNVFPMKARTKVSCWSQAPNDDSLSQPPSARYLAWERGVTAGYSVSARHCFPLIRSSLMLFRVPWGLWWGWSGWWQAVLQSGTELAAWWEHL